MKKLIGPVAFYFMTLSILASVIILCIGIMQPEVYPICGEVIYVDQNTRVIIFQEPNGQTWRFEYAEEWRVGDTAAAITDGNKIISVRRE